MDRNFEIKLHAEGFHFLSGYVFTPRLEKFLLDESNYPKYHVFDHPYTEMDQIRDPELTSDLINGLPYYIKELIKPYDIFWNARMGFKGFCIEPHNDEVGYNPEMRIGMANIVLWLCPYPFEGRDFAWGSVVNHAKLPKLYNMSNNTIFYHDDPNFKVLGKIKPATGLGVITSKKNPMYWHAVDKQTSIAATVAIRGSIWEK